VLIYLLRSLRARKAEAGKDKSVIFVNNKNTGYFCQQQKHTGLKFLSSVTQCDGREVSQTAVP
jgi:hypothetical protein